MTSTLTYADVVGFFSKIEGRVDILKEGAARAASINVNDPVSLGDIVRTKSDGKAEITFKDDTTVRVAPESRLKIDEYAFNPDNTRNKGILNLFRGKVRAVVSKAKAIIPVAFGESSFNVNTPTAVAGVRGTDFFVFHDRGITGVIFKEGSGFVQNPNVPEKIVPINAGQATFIIQPDAPPLPPRPASNIELAVHTKDTTLQEKPKEEKEKEEKPKAAEAEAAAPVDINAAVAETAASVDIASASTSVETLTTSDGGVFGFTAPTETIIAAITEVVTTSETTLDGSLDTSNILPITESVITTLTTATTTSTNAFAGSLSGGFMYPDILYYGLTDDTLSSLTGAFAGTGDLWSGAPVSFYASGASSNPNNRIAWWGDMFGIATDGGQFLGAIDGFSVGGSLEGRGIALYIRPDGTAGYLKTNPMTGYFDASGAWYVSGNLTSQFMGYTALPPSILYDDYYLATGSPYIDWGEAKGYIIGSGFSGSDWSGNISISDQNWGIWVGDTQGSYSILPPLNWTARAGGKTYDDLGNFSGYYIGQALGTDWSNGKLLGNISGRGLDKSEMFTFNGEIFGAYDTLGNWQAQSLGTYTETPLAWSGDVYADNSAYPSYCLYNCGNFMSLPWNATYSDELTADGFMQGLLGGTASLWSGSPFLAMGAYSNPNNRPLWFAYTEGATTDSGKFLNFMLGITMNNLLEGGAIGIYIKSDGTTGYIKSDNIFGTFYSDIGMWEADGTLAALQKGTTSVLPTYLYGSSPYLEWGDDFGSIGGNYITGSIALESVNLIDQDWGIWFAYGGGSYSPAMASPSWTANIGGKTYDDYAVLDGYWLGSISGTEWAGGKLKGIVSGRFLSKYEFGQFDGKILGVYDAARYNWQADSLGTYTETPLVLSGKIVPDNNTNFAYAGAGLYSLDTSWLWLDIEGNSTGLMGGITSTGSGGNITFMGQYDVINGNGWGPPYLWTPEIYSYNAANLTFTTYDGWAYKGFIGGIWRDIDGNPLTINDREIAARAYSLYIDPLGNAGILKGNLTGSYYPEIGMFEANGAWSPVQLVAGGFLASDLYAQTNIILSNYFYNMTSLGDFNGLGSITVSGDEMLTYDTWRYSISGQNWGVWKTIIGGDYLGAPSDIWTLYTNQVFAGQAIGTNTIGALWSGNKIEGKTFAYGADITTTPNTWISVGETIGTFDPINFTWQAVQMGAWVDTNKFLAMRGTPEGQAALTQLNIPFVEVGRTNLTGSGTMGGAPVNVYMNDTTFFAYSNGASPKIWATNAVGGDYGCSACGSTTVGLTGANGLGANFNIQTFDTAAQKWTATVDGGGTYTGTGTMNGSAVNFEGAAAGTNTGIGPGTFSGTAAGVAK